MSFIVQIGLMVVWVVSDSHGSVCTDQSQKTQGFVSQILRHYLAKEGCVQKLRYCLIPIKDPCARKYEELPRSKILGILQTETNLYCQRLKYHGGISNFQLLFNGRGLT